MAAGLPGCFTICQSARAKESGAKPVAGAGVVAEMIAFAVRRASESAVSEGFAEPRLGNRAGPATYAFALPWNLPFVSVIDAPGAPINRVPAS